MVLITTTSAYFLLYMKERNFGLAFIEIVMCLGAQQMLLQMATLLTIIGVNAEKIVPVKVKVHT